MFLSDMNDCIPLSVLQFTRNIYVTGTYMLQGTFMLQGTYMLPGTYKRTMSIRKPGRILLLVRS